MPTSFRELRFFAEYYILTLLSCCKLVTNKNCNFSISFLLFSTVHLVYLAPDGCLEKTLIRTHLWIQIGSLKIKVNKKAFK